MSLHRTPTEPVELAARALRANGSARRILGSVAIASTIYVVLLNALTLTRGPEPYGDEAWVGSAVWSLTHGHGLRPEIATGSGIYAQTDYWMPRIGIAPQIVAEVLFGTSFTAYRAASLVVSLIALGILWLGLRRLYHPAISALAVAGVATTWIFVSASHYIRWDDVTLLWTCLIFAILVWSGSPHRRALAVGLLIGVAPDFSVPMVSLLPAALLILLWRSSRRLPTSLWFVAGVTTGVVAYVLMHFATGLDAARSQYQLVYASAYRLPLLDAVDHMSLAPIWRERLRYEEMTGPFADSRTFLLVGLICAGVAIANVARSRDVRRAVGSLLLISQLAGLALLYANRGPAYAIGAVPFAAVAFVEGFSLIPRFRLLAPAIALLIPTIVGGRAVMAGMNASFRSAATNAHVSQIARSMLGPGQTALGDYVYWWLYRDDRFRFNADLWVDEYKHHVSLRQAFADTCPNVVVYDDEWEARYPADVPGSLGYRFPALAPTDPNEESKLMQILLRDYRFPPRIVVAGGRVVTFWRRARPTCD